MISSIKAKSEKESTNLSDRITKSERYYQNLVVQTAKYEDMHKEDECQSTEYCHTAINEQIFFA